MAQNQYSGRNFFLPRARKKLTLVYTHISHNDQIIDNCTGGHVIILYDNRASNDLTIPPHVWLMNPTSATETLCMYLIRI